MRKMLCLLVCCLAGNFVGATTIYSNDFESSVGSEWSATTIKQTPSGQRFLGDWSNTLVTLSLGSIPSHTDIKLEFDLYILQTMDGNNGDIWTLAIQDGPVLLNTTFTNLNNSGQGPRQSYPDNYPSSHPAHTGASAVRSLGYKAGDSTYHLVYTFNHLEDDVVINFQGSSMQSVSDESWGLDNIIVTAVPEPTTISLLTIGFMGILKKRN
ncbi:hypothetical protein SMSP2_01103 [Limihaloglobus sulfuriphilus]|uniref:PEP-CTERM protein-sorting domain-containing protein n=1 Tax=Limihaloglobus sulfuriphilus TaxID=1851148 RepID=A0A1Q2MES0_9BACT|nr:PEP-CTERM sorting domain-containing protein [Limihaloglobus sulfuriphilus]AQQ70742.1 hypothetical protein SMSP2_01103 [Limihaloglobus sulfuriphilus]